MHGEKLKQPKYQAIITKMSDGQRIYTSKINVVLLLIAWVGAIAISNISENSEAEFTPVEVVLSNDDEEAPPEKKEPPVKEEVTSPPDEKVTPNDEPERHEEDLFGKDETVALADETITPPNVDIVPAVSDEKPLAQKKERVGKIKVDATYLSSPREIFPWLIDRGARILLLDENIRLLAEVNRDGFIEQPIRKGGDGGVSRAANAEISEFVQSPLPYDTKYAVVWWPDAIWKRILSPIEAYHSHSAQISYRIQNNTLLVTIDSAATEQGIIFPGEVVHIR